MGVLPFIVACAPSDRNGGQSGTESDGSCATFETRTPDLDEVLEPLGQSANDWAASIGTLAAPGRWLSTTAQSELSFEFGPLTSAREFVGLSNGDLCSWELELESATIRTSDGAIDLQGPVHLGWVDVVNQPLTLHLAIPSLAESHLGSPVWGGDVAWVRNWANEQIRPMPGVPTSLVVQIGGPLSELRAAVFHEDEIVGVWDTYEYALPPGPPADYTPDAALAGSCSSSAQFANSELEYTSFATAAAALEGMTGTWARCRDHAASDHAGLRILPDGTWHHVEIEAGELVARHGFGHEGFLQFIDTSDMNGIEGFFQVNMFGGAGTTWASERALIFRASVEGWPAAVYLPSALPVRTIAPEYADGERAGAAACEGGEYGITSTFEETTSALTGEYVLCNGSLPGGVAKIRFAEPSIELMHQDGSLIAALDYQREEMNAPRLSLTLGGGDQYRFWLVSASRHPRKIEIVESLDGSTETAIFSAVP